MASTPRQRWRDLVRTKDGPPDAGARLVALGIEKHVNHHTLATWVSEAKLQETTGLRERAIRKHLQALIRDGWLASEEKGRSRGWRTRHLTLTFPLHAPAENAAPHALDAAVENAAAPNTSPDAAAEKAASCGRKRPMLRQDLPPILRKRNSDPEHDQDSCAESDSEKAQTIAELDLDADAIAIVQRARPGADPLAILRAFRRWGKEKPAAGWRRSLATFAIGERLSDDEMRAEAACIHNRCAPRRPGESLAEFAARVADPPIDAKVREAIAHARTTLAGGAA